MRRYIAILLVVILMFLSGCASASSTKFKVTPRQYLTAEERTEFLTELQESSGVVEDNAILYSEDGIIITSNHKLEVESWKLYELAQAYEKQNKLDYVISSEDLPKESEDWMHSVVTTKDFRCIVRLYGDDESMTLDVKLDDEYAGKYILAPQSCIINGVLKEKTLFRASESEAGHFLITARMEDFKGLEMFGLTMENISSLAWYLGAINTETKQLESFLLAAAFPDDYTWDGLQVAESYSADGGIVMWVKRDGDSAYLCTFNGTTTKIESEIKVTAAAGDLISDTFTLEVCSGEFVYQKIGFNVAGVTVYKGDTLIFSE